MRKLPHPLWTMLVPLHLVACGSETPAFQEKPQAVITVAVTKAEDPSQISGESFDIESLSADDADEGRGSADATADTASGSANIDGAKGLNRGTTRDANTAPRPGFPENNPAPIEQRAPASDQASDSAPLPNPDTKTVAKACAPALRNLGKPMTVISVDEKQSAITISPNSVLAVKIVGDRTKVVLNLDASTPLLGICFFLAGHETELQFSTASALSSLAIVETGDQSKADIRLNAGSSDALAVDLRGHNPSLTIQGVSASLCEAAHPRREGSAFICTP